MSSLPIDAPRLTGGGGRIEGVVRDLETGRPIGGATLLIRPVRSSYSGTTYPTAPFFRTAADGAFDLDGLPDGRFYVDAAAPGYLSHRHSALPDLFGDEWRGNTPFALLRRADESGWDAAWDEEFDDLDVLRHHFPRVETGKTTRIVISLRKGHVFHGRVRDSSGAPISGAMVEHSSQQVKVPGGCFGVQRMSSSTTDAEGRFDLCVFPGNGVVVRIAAKGRATMHQKFDPLPERPVDISLFPGSNLRGRVAGADGVAARRTRVVAFSPADPESGVMTDSFDGTWILEDAPAPPFIVLASHGFAGGVIVQVADPAVELNLVLTPWKTAHGRLVDSAGAPVEGEFIRQAFDPHLDRNTHKFAEWNIGDLAKSDADGRFSLAVIPDSEGKALLHFDYHLDPVRVELGAEFALVVSEKTVESRKYSVSSCIVTQAVRPPIPKPDLTPAQFGERNARWIELLETAPPAERVRLLSELRDEACGSDIADPPPPSDRMDLLPVFEAGVGNDDGNTAFWAISAIHCMNRRETFPFLVRSLEHPDPHIRSYAIMSIQQLANHADLKPAAVEALREALKRERQSWEVTLDAACALAELGEKIDPRRFAEALKDDRLDCRSAVRGLAVLHCRESVEMILNRFERGDPWNSHHFWRALESLTGRKLGSVPGPWREWLDKNRASLPAQWV